MIVMSRRRFENSDIPYADRILMRKYKTTAEHRDDAAKTALQIACVALNDTEGLGLIRLTRFAKRVQQLTHEYYEDPDVQSQHLEERLTQLGFEMVDGHMWVLEKVESSPEKPEEGKEK